MALSFPTRCTTLTTIGIILFHVCATDTHAAPQNQPSVNIYGIQGLNTVPTARMDTPGTVRAGLAALDPYTHAFLGFQIAEPLYINLRQTGESSGIKDDPDRLYPGMDFKLRLKKETAYIPEIAIGLQSAFGHRRTAAEYLAFSKRYRDFDFTGGLAWGRLGSAAHFKNPLGKISSHFKKTRDGNSETAANTSDWFTGPDIGLFAGLEYFTPLENLSVKAEWGADRYTAERAAFGYDAPAPWSLGINYSPRPWTSLSAAVAGTGKIMARLSLQSPVAKWPGLPDKHDPPPPLNPLRSTEATPEEMILSAQKGEISLHSPIADNSAIEAHLNLPPYKNPARHLGRAARIMANHGGKEAGKIIIHPRIYGLKGPSIHLIRRDLESAIARKQGSPEEIWHSATFDTDPDIPEPSSHATKIRFPEWPRLILEMQASLGEEDTGFLYRTSLLLDARRPLASEILAGGALRLNLADNLDRLHRYRGLSTDPVREDASVFVENLLTVDRSYLSWLHSLNTQTHLAATAGYLEEMYAGAGGEIIYRPFGKTWAAGAELWHAYKRDPYTVMTLGLIPDKGRTTGHVNLWYEAPWENLTFHARIGRYLAGDFGATLSVQRQIRNGAKLEGFLTATNQTDRDIFGGNTHLYGGLRLSLPMGNFKYLPEGSEIRAATLPFARRAGQTLENPIPLYDLTDPLSYRRLSQSWPEIVE